MVLSVKGLIGAGFALIGMYTVAWRVFLWVFPRVAFVCGFVCGFVRPSTRFENKLRHLTRLQQEAEPDDLPPFSPTVGKEPRRDVYVPRVRPVKPRA